MFGAAAIVLGAQLLIDNGTALAQMLGVPDAIIGATMIAIGTSLPELVTTITAIRKKQSSLSVGNIIGANIMDLTLIMPLCALILGKPLPVERQGMLLDIPACLVVCAGALIPALVQGRFKRWVGFFIGALYIAYLVIMFTCFGDRRRCLFWERRADAAGDAGRVCLLKMRKRCLIELLMRKEMRKENDLYRLSMRQVHPPAREY